MSKRKRSRPAKAVADAVARDIGGRMEAERVAKGKSREDASKALRWSELRVWRLERGVTRQRAEDIQAYADWLEVSVKCFYGEAAA